MDLLSLTLPALLSLFCLSYSFVRNGRAFVFSTPKGITSVIISIITMIYTIITNVPSHTSSIANITSSSASVYTV